RKMAGIANAEVEVYSENGAAFLDRKLRVRKRLVDDGLSGRGPQRDQRRSRKSERQKPAIYGSRHHHPPPMERCTPERRVKMVFCVLSVKVWQAPVQSRSSATV